MKPQAIAAANTRLERASRSVSRLIEAGFDFPALQTAWEGFLIAASGIYAKLEQGAKGHGPSEAWYGRAKHLRRTDQLLSYLHHARNSEEHSLEGSAHPDKGDIVSTDSRTRVTRNGEGVVTNVTVALGEPVSLRVIPPGLRLARVKDDRFNDQFDPPVEHLGKPLADASPAAVALLGLAFLQALIEDAKHLPPH